MAFIHLIYFANVFVLAAMQQTTPAPAVANLAVVSPPQPPQGINPPLQGINPPPQGINPPPQGINSPPQGINPPPLPPQGINQSTPLPILPVNNVPVQQNTTQQSITNPAPVQDPTEVADLNGTQSTTVQTTTPQTTTTEYVSTTTTTPGPSTPTPGPTTTPSLINMIENQLGRGAAKLADEETLLSSILQDFESLKEQLIAVDRQIMIRNGQWPTTTSPATTIQETTTQAETTTPQMTTGVQNATQQQAAAVVAQNTTAGNPVPTQILQNSTNPAPAANG